MYRLKTGQKYKRIIQEKLSEEGLVRESDVKARSDEV